MAVNCKTAEPLTSSRNWAGGAKQNRNISDNEEASDDVYSPWPQPKSLWDD